MPQTQPSPEQQMNEILYGNQPSSGTPSAAAIPATSSPAAAVPVGSEDQEMNKILHGDGAGTGAGTSPEKESKVNQLVNEVAGPGTYLGEIAEGEYNIGAGVKRMVQGDVIGGAKQAVGDIGGAKRMLNATASRGSDQIDAQKHPILKAGLEFAEGMTSPVNLGLVIASGGLGMVDSAAKIYMVHQLANAGLTSQQIVDMYNRFPEVKKAWDKGDSAKVLYEGTHLLLSGVLSAAGMLDMAGKPMEVVGERPQAVANAAAEGVRTVAGKVAEVPGKVVSKVKGKLAAPEAEVESNPIEDLKAAFPPSKTNPYEENAPQVAYNALAAEHKLNTIHDPTEAAAALQEQISKAENKVMEGAIQQVPNEPISKKGEPISVWNEVKSELNSRKIEREGFVDDAMKELEKYGFRQGKPTTVADADRIRRQLNDETTAIEKKPDYQQVRIENVDPKYAALQYAKDVLRDGVYDTVDAHGLDKGVTARDFRRDIIGNMISFRNAMLDKAYSGDQPVKGTAPEAPKESLTRQAVRGAIQVGTPALASAAIGSTVGHPFAGAGVGAEMGAMSPVAARMAEKIVPKPEVPEDLTRAELLDRALNHPEADKFITETPEEQQIRGRIQKPATTPAKGQTEVPFGPPELFGENQGEAGPMEMRPDQLNKISAYIAKLREALENPTATSVEKDAAQHQIETIFGGKIPEGFKRPKEQGVVKSTPKLLETSRFEEPWQVSNSMGMDIKAILNHELAHAALAHMAGFEPEDIISHEHEAAHEKTVAAARINMPEDMVRTPTGSIEPKALRERLPDVLAVTIAGGMANELYDGVKWEDNKLLGSDLKDIDETLDLLGLSAEEKDRFIEWGKTRAKAVLQDSDVENLINEFSDTRERGLPSSHHYSAARMNEFKDRLDSLRGKNANNPEGASAGSTKRNQAGKSGGARTLETSTIAENPAGESKVTWPERTTGVHDTAIKEGGAIPGGIQKGDPEIGLKDLILFHDPQSGSTLALNPDKVTKENVMAELEKSREMYRQAEIRKQERLRQATREALEGKFAK